MTGDQLAVPTVTQGEKCDIPKRPGGPVWVYTSYDRYATTYPIGQPIQLRLGGSGHNGDGGR